MSHTFTRFNIPCNLASPEKKKSPKWPQRCSKHQKSPHKLPDSDLLIGLDITNSGNASATLPSFTSRYQLIRHFPEFRMFIYHSNGVPRASTKFYNGIFPLQFLGKVLWISLWPSLVITHIWKNTWYFEPKKAKFILWPWYIVNKTPSMH